MSLELLERSQKKKQDIKFQKPTLSREDLENVLECLIEEHLSTGEIVDRFEKVFGSTFKFKNTVSVNSLTSAYHLSLLALGVGQGDRVILSSFASHNALDAVLLVGAQPVVVDLARDSFHMDSELFHFLAEKFSPKVAILDHNFGCLTSRTPYQREGLLYIEDFSEAIGADSNSIEVGKQGDISVCALSVNQVITTGNGAMICTADKDMAKGIRSRKLGFGDRDGSPKFDYNLIDYQAALGMEQLSKLGVLIDRKRKIAQIYLQAVKTAGQATWFNNPNEDQFNRFPVIISNPFDEVERYFNSLQIETHKTTIEPLHRVMDLPGSDFSNAERLFQRGHCIPIYPNLTRENILRISGSLKGIY